MCMKVKTPEYKEPEPAPAPLPPDKDNGGLRGSVGSIASEQKRAAKLIGRQSLRIDRAASGVGSASNSSGLNSI